MTDKLSATSPKKNIWRSIRGRAINWYVDTYNAIRSGHTNTGTASGISAFEEIQQHARKRSDINEHLAMLFAETIRMRPKLIVEMGVRGGESTFAFERAAQFSDATLLSIDIDDCESASSYPHWHFLQADDIAFSKEFPAWCKNQGIEPKVEVMFIDTSHFYDHTVQEIEHWFPYLADHAIVFFHDTNMQDIYRRRDGSLGRGWQNDRGVIRAVEDYFKKSFDETRDFVHVEPGWIIRHYAHNSGMTVLERIAETDTAKQ
ncbi:MAG: class I SAM-dependent methyltransferase [Bacteroidota bacterium]